MSLSDLSDRKLIALVYTVLNDVTPGEWTYTGEMDGRITQENYDICEVWFGPPEAEANGKFIAESKPLIEELVKRLERRNDV